LVTLSFLYQQKEEEEVAYKELLFSHILYNFYYILSQILHEFSQLNNPSFFFFFFFIGGI